MAAILDFEDTHSTLLLLKFPLANMIYQNSVETLL